jgi:hypothetical protein
MNAESCFIHPVFFENCHVSKLGTITVRNIKLHKSVPDLRDGFFLLLLILKINIIV